MVIVSYCEPGFVCYTTKHLDCCYFRVKHIKFVIFNPVQECVLSLSRLLGEDLYPMLIHAVTFYSIALHWSVGVTTSQGN